NALSLDRVIAIAHSQQVTQPYAIALPVGPVGVYSVMSDRNQAFNRTYLHLDQYSGRILADVRFKDFGYLAQFMLWAIIAHEGQLFGVINQILGTMAAAGVLLLGISGLMMWWQRRPEDRFFAPASDARLPRVVFIGTIILGCLLPLLGASLVLGWLVERLVFRSAVIKG
ncbi:MAG: PepSY domain-containing protein, partial [Lacunisphaera sp.]